MPTKDEIKEFSALIDKIVSESKDLGYMEAITQHCSETGLEIEVAATLITPALKAKLRIEAQDSNMLKRSSRLPI
jgi:hypothetical protein